MTLRLFYGGVLKYEKLKRFCAICNHGKGGTDKDWRGKQLRS